MSALAASVAVSLRPGFEVESTAAGAFLVHGDRRVEIGTSRGLREAASRLAAGDSTEARLADMVAESGDPADLARWYSILRTLAAAGGVEYAVRDGGLVLARSIPGTADHGGDFTPPRGRCVLSRFACLRRRADTVLVDSPLTACRVELLDRRAVSLVAALLVPADVGDLQAPEASATWVPSLLALLRDAGLLLDVDDAGETIEGRDEATGYWTFADLVFHGRVRTRRRDLPVGDTYPLGVREPPVPAVKPPTTNRRIALFAPSLATLAETDPPFTSVHESRASLRTYGEKPLSVEQLGEFLYRTARVRQHPLLGSVEVPYPIAWRLYPGGGACYPLEVYALVDRCRGLDAGLYHYDPLSHALEELDDPRGEAPRTLSEVAGLIGGRPPDVLFVLTARFGRMAWKYEGIAYALLLQEVGGVYQSMYLVATAMGLAPCARGGGDGERFPRAIGVDPLEECFAGSFMLGSRPERD